jgi:hypothetical protein
LAPQKLCDSYIPRQNLIFVEAIHELPLLFFAKAYFLKVIQRGQCDRLLLLRVSGGSRRNLSEISGEVQSTFRGMEVAIESEVWVCFSTMTVTTFADMLRTWAAK